MENFSTVNKSDTFNRLAFIKRVHRQNLLKHDPLDNHLVDCEKIFLNPVTCEKCGGDFKTKYGQSRFCPKCREAPPIPKGVSNKYLVFLKKHFPKNTFTAKEASLTYPVSLSLVTTRKILNEFVQTGDLILLPIGGKNKVNCYYIA